MKTIIRKSVLTVLMLGTLSSYAIGTNLVEGNRTKEKIALNNVKKGQRWFIKNATGKVLHEEEIKNNGSFSQDFDFTSLKNGYYILEVNKDFKIDVTPFTIILGEVIFHKKAEKTIFKPVIRNVENKVLISKFNFDITPSKVMIYYEDKMIFKDTVKGESILKKVYVLQKDKKGSYKVIIKANDRTYINEFSL